LEVGASDKTGAVQVQYPHPAFAKLFIETELLADSGAILATRRRRTPTEPAIWVGHLSVGEGTVTVETDRTRFIGRGYGVRDPVAVARDAILSGTVGTVLDAVASVRRRVTIAPGAIVKVAFWTIAAASREDAVACIDRHRDANAFDRASTVPADGGPVTHPCSTAPAGEVPKR
jgi:cyclic beta-1,2-glucan synthetase